jgi:hypothetical protein
LMWLQHMNQLNYWHLTQVGESHFFFINKKDMCPVRKYLIRYAAVIFEWSDLNTFRIFSWFDQCSPPMLFFTRVSPTKCYTAHNFSTTVYWTKVISHADWWTQVDGATAYVLFAEPNFFSRMIHFCKDHIVPNVLLFFNFNCSSWEYFCTSYKTKQKYIREIIPDQYIMSML